MKRAFFLTMIFLLNGSWLLSQVAISADGSTPHATAVLDLQSTNQGFLLPRLTTNQQMNIYEPASGLMVYNLDSNDIYFYNGSYWLSLRNLADTLRCGDSLTDIRDARVYATIQIGTQCWMKENLNTGNRIDGSQDQTDNSVIEKYCYNDLESNCNIYGGLYQWDEMMQYTSQEGAQGICPDGWHVPSDAEWTALTDYVSSQSGYFCNANPSYIGKALAATTLWNISTTTCAIGNNLAANNATGFSGMPGGSRGYDGGFGNVGYYGGWWASTEGYDGAWSHYLSYDYPEVFRCDYILGFGSSVRCLRD